MEENKPALSIQKLIFGLVLMTFGVLAFVDSMDLWNPGQWWRLWPVALIVLGLGSEADALFARRPSGGGVFLLAVGVWMFVARSGYFGLSHRTAFPLAIAVVGLFMTLHALVDKPQPEAQKKETNHEPC